MAKDSELKVSKRMKNNMFLLKCLHQAPTKRVRNRLVKALDDEAMNAICECALNVLKRNVPIPDGNKPALNAQRFNLARLIDKKKSKKTKKEILQKGGLLPALLGLMVAPMLADAILK